MKYYETLNPQRATLNRNTQIRRSAPCSLLCAPRSQLRLIKLIQGYSRQEKKFQKTKSHCRLANFVTAAGTPDSSGSNPRLSHICRMNAAFRLSSKMRPLAAGAPFSASTLMLNCLCWIP